MTTRNWVRPLGLLTFVVWLTPLHAHHAGVMFEEHVTTMTEDQWDAMLSVNLRAPFLLTKHATPLMKANGGGSIINIGSIEGEAANPKHTAYCTTKAGIKARCTCC